MFAEEREHLLPIPIVEDRNSAKMLRTVRKDNTVLYNGNRYSVPVGTYTHQKEVCLETEGSILKIYTTTSDLICEHTISESKGLLIKNRSHERDTQAPVNGLKDKLKEKLRHQADDQYQPVEEKILSMYAKGMTTSDIEEHIRDIYGIEVSELQIRSFPVQENGSSALWRRSMRLYSWTPSIIMCAARVESSRKQSISPSESIWMVAKMY